MSSAINHKKRSRRGYKMQRTHLATKKTPLISHSKQITRGLMNQIFRRIMGLAD